MKIAIISDIHGNLEALKATLNNIEKRKVDKIICLGDIIVPYDMDKELGDEYLNIEKENYQFELREGKYRDMSKINKYFESLGIDVDKI